MPFARGSGFGFTMRCLNIALVYGKRRARFCAIPARCSASTAAGTGSDAAGVRPGNGRRENQGRTNPGIVARPHHCCLNLKNFGTRYQFRPKPHPISVRRKTGLPLRYLFNRKNCCVPEMGLVTVFCPLTTTGAVGTASQTGETEVCGGLERETGGIGWPRQNHIGSRRDKVSCGGLTGSTIMLSRASPQSSDGSCRFAERQCCRFQKR